MVWTRQESILASTKLHPFTMSYRTAVTEEGRILGMEADIVGDAGPIPVSPLVAKSESPVLASRSPHSWVGSSCSRLKSDQLG